MRTPVRIAQFKAQLSKYLRAAQRGAEIVIKDRDTPIARLVPYNGAPTERLVIRSAIGSLKDIDELPTYPPPPGLTWEHVEQALKEDRREAIDELLDEGLR